MEGEIDMVLDDCEVHLAADMCWCSRDQPCLREPRQAGVPDRYVLIDAAI